MATKNQIEWMKLQELKRSNLANERLTQTRDTRAHEVNLGTLEESKRKNKAVESETARHNRAVEEAAIIDLGIKSREADTHRYTAETGRMAHYETARSNLAREAETHRANVAYESELSRSNKAREYENARHNLAAETETMRSNVVRENETHRSNVASERNTRERNRSEARVNEARIVNLDAQTQTEKVRKVREAAQTVDLLASGAANLINTRSNMLKAIGEIIPF